MAGAILAADVRAAKAAAAMERAESGGCGPGGCGPGGGGDGYAMNGGDPNDPNGAHGYAHGPIPRGVGGEYLGAAGPPTGAVAYPYYTNRGPRDYLAANPPSIGP